MKTFIFRITIVEEANIYWIQWSPKSGLIYPMKDAQFTGFGEQQKKVIHIDDNFVGNEARFLSAKHMEKIEETNNKNDADKMDGKQILFHINQNRSTSEHEQQDSNESGSGEEETTAVVNESTSKSPSTKISNFESTKAMSTTLKENSHATKEEDISTTKKLIITKPTTVRTTLKPTTISTVTQSKTTKTTLKTSNPTTNVLGKVTASTTEHATHQTSSPTTPKPKVTTSAFSTGTTSKTKVASTVSPINHDVTKNHKTMAHENITAEMNESHSVAVSASHHSMTETTVRPKSTTENLGLKHANIKKAKLDAEINADIEEILNSTSNQTEIEALQLFYLNNHTNSNESNPLKPAVKFIESFNSKLMDKKKIKSNERNIVSTKSPRNVSAEEDMVMINKISTHASDESSSNPENELMTEKASEEVTTGKTT